MTSLKRLAVKDDELVKVHIPITNEEVANRQVDYNLMQPIKFARKYSNLFLPASFTLNGKVNPIQYNHCTNPFCKWHGQPQEKFSSIKGKPSRYKLVGNADYRHRIVCNPDPINPNVGMTFNCNTTPISNWSVAEEISRLVRNESIQDIKPEYVFHKEGCKFEGKTPFEHSESFYKKGKSKSNSPRFQCKECKKITNILPTRKQSTTYHQQRNDILPIIFRMIMNKMPVSRTVEALNIGVSTYYHKLEWIYRRCLEFLERHERAALSQMEFDKMWINTDKMIYFLNNVRKTTILKRVSSQLRLLFPAMFIRDISLEPMWLMIGKLHKRNCWLTL